MNYLILVRHGESRWNLVNKFTGWTDVPLSSNGVLEAEQTAKALKDFHISVAFTSTLVRAQSTLQVILSEQDYTGIVMHHAGKQKRWSMHHHPLSDREIPVFYASELNERYYGKLQGLNKDDARKKWGEEQVFKWRRSFDIRPPGGESLKDTCKRAVPYFQKRILPELKKGENVMIAAHGNSLRAIMKHIEGISDEEIPHLELPTGKPIVYDFVRGKLKRDEKPTFIRPVKWKSKWA